MADNQVGEDTLALWTDRWHQDWDENRHGRGQVKKFLVDHIEKMTEGRTGLRFLVPCCGQSIEMKWLADQGHEVVGIEGVEKACENFYKNENLKYDVSGIQGIPEGKLYKGESCKVQIYNTDIFKLNENILGQFDAIFDRGAFVIVNFEDRPRYAALMKSVAKSKCKILLAVQEYDWKERTIKGPPRPAFRNDVEELYGKWCTIKELERSDRLKNRNPEKFKNSWGTGLTSHWSVQYLLQVM